RASPDRPKTPRLSPSVRAEAVDTRPAFQSDLTRAVRGPERFGGGFAPSAPPMVPGGLSRTGSAAESQRTSGDTARAFEWQLDRLCRCVVLTDECDQWRARANRHRPAPPDRPQGVRPRRTPDRNHRRGLPRRRHGCPEWAAIRTGLFGRDAFVPLEPSELVDGALHVPFERALIKDAPDFGVGRHLSPEQDLQLYHHYGLDVAAPPPLPDRDFGKLAGQDEPA